MTKIQNSKSACASRQYDLEKRTFKFARKCRNYLRKLPKGISNTEYTKQLIRSSSSVAANYIETNESLSKKGFAHRIKICRKEAKENRLWLRLIEPRIENQKGKGQLFQEATELMKIFGVIIEKCK